MGTRTAPEGGLPGEAAAASPWAAGGRVSASSVCPWTSLPEPDPGSANYWPDAPADPGDAYTAMAASTSWGQTAGGCVCVGLPPRPPVPPGRVAALAGVPGPFFPVTRL